jgi:glucan biosynthesis protein
MNSISAKEFDQNPDLHSMVQPDNDLKNFLVEYAGGELQPDNNEVTVEMVIEVVARDFPEFVLALAEENWVRGYQQALDDVDTGQKMLELEGINSDQQKED